MAPALGHHQLRTGRPPDPETFARSHGHGPAVAWTWRKGWRGMTPPKPLQSPERDVLLVSALIAIVVVLAFTDWGLLAYVVTGLVVAALLLASAIANRRATHR
jgi:hypothetical protein